MVYANQKAFGVENRFLSDGNVLPTLGAANFALTIIAAAARLVDHRCRRQANHPQR